ncbi:hypothetical protein BH09ACT10_BH09ACT10_17380 [soil metagenome]
MVRTPLIATIAFGIALAAALPANATGSTADGATPSVEVAKSSAQLKIAATTPVKLPKDPTGLVAPVALPADLDAPSPYLPQNACVPSDQTGIKKLRDLVLATYQVGGRGNSSRSCAVAGTSEHKEGRAWDWMVNVKNPAEKAAAADFLSWVTANQGANARRLGIMYVIYNKKIWAVYRAGDGWRPSVGHTDHIHVSLSWNGARANTSFWKGKTFATDYGPCAVFAGQPAVPRKTPRLTRCGATAPLVKKTSYANRMYGSNASTVKTAQGVLKIAKSGRFDVATYKAVKAYQKAHDLPITGGLDQPTWASLRPTKVKSDVSKGYDVATLATYSLKKYGSTTLKSKSAGKAVLYLQNVLGLALADSNGYFGPKTVAATKALQKSAGLKQTGVVGKAEWSALAAKTA